MQEYDREGKTREQEIHFQKMCCKHTRFSVGSKHKCMFFEPVIICAVWIFEALFSTEKTCGVAINRLLGRDRGNHLLKCCGFSKYSFTDKMDYSIFKENAAYSSGNENNKKVLENA